MRLVVISRKSLEKKGNGNSSDTDESLDDYSLDSIPVIKRKRAKGKSQSKAAKRKKYNVLKNIKNGK